MCTPYFCLVSRLSSISFSLQCQHLNMKYSDTYIYMFFFKTYSRHTDRIPPGCASCGCDKPDYPRTFAWRHWVQLAWRWGWSGSKLCRESLATADRWGSRTESWHGYPGQGGPSSWLSGWTPCAGRGLGGRWWLHLKDVRKRKRTLEYFSWCSFKAHWFNLKFEFYAPVKNIWRDFGPSF